MISDALVNMLTNKRKNGAAQLIEKQLTRSGSAGQGHGIAPRRALPGTPPPLSRPGPAGASTPRGGTRRAITLPLSVTPCSDFQNGSGVRA